MFGSILGHIGDGNFHETILFEDQQRKEVEDCVHRMVSRALDMDGTCTVGIDLPHGCEIANIDIDRVSTALVLGRRIFFEKRLAMCLSR